MVYDYAGKENLFKSYWNPKTKLGKTAHFSGIIELQFGKKMPYIAPYLKLFCFCLAISQKCVVNPDFFFEGDWNSPC